jgi:hypothetical protein
MSMVLKVAAGLNTLTAVLHAAMANDLFPALDNESIKPSTPSKMRAAAKIGWMEVCGFFGLSGMFPSYCQRRNDRVENMGG